AAARPRDPRSPSPSARPRNDATKEDEPGAPPAPPPSARLPVPEAPLEAWRLIIERIERERPEIAAFLMHGAPLEISPVELLVGFEPHSVFVSEVSTDVALTLVARSAEACFGPPFRVRYEKESPRAVGARTLSRVENEAEEKRIRDALGQARSHQRVTEAVEVLGARIKDIRLGKR
ncbi:MAG TPA: hypothetical protein VM686_21870, partial [Polyangiaceae bacterium]|nr:hypothetical protein [Polyangiaceae bacterium]